MVCRSSIEDVGLRVFERLPARVKSDSWVALTWPITCNSLATSSYPEREIRMESDLEKNASLHTFTSTSTSHPPPYEEHPMADQAGVNARPQYPFRKALLQPIWTLTCNALLHFTIYACCQAFVTPDQTCSTSLLANSTQHMLETAILGLLPLVSLILVFGTSYDDIESASSILCLCALLVSWIGTAINTGFAAQRIHWCSQVVRN